MILKITIPESLEYNGAFDETFARAAGGPEDVKLFVSADCVEGNRGGLMAGVEADGVVASVIGGAGPAELVWDAVNREGSGSVEAARSLIGSGVESGPLVEPARGDDSFKSFARAPN